MAKTGKGTRVSRRVALRTAVLGATGVSLGVAAGQGRAATAAQQPRGLEGAWSVRVRDEESGRQTASILRTVAAGGGFVDVYSQLPPLGVISQGSWEAVGEREYVLMSIGYRFDANGQFSHLLRAHGRITLDESGDGFSGTAQAARLDGSLTVLDTFPPLLVTGRRIPTQPQP